MTTAVGCEWNQQCQYQSLTHAACSSAIQYWQNKDDHNAQAGVSHMTAADSKPQAVHDTHDCNTLLCRHVEMLRDDMSLLKKEMQTTHADLSGAVSITSNIDSRFHMLESEMHSVWKKMKDDETAKADKAAAARSQSSSRVSHATLPSINHTNACEPVERHPWYYQQTHRSV